MLGSEGDDIFDFLDVLPPDGVGERDELFLLAAFHRLFLFVFEGDGLRVERFQSAGHLPVVFQFGFHGLADVFGVLPFLKNTIDK